MELAVYGNSYFAQEALLYRVLGVILVSGLGLFVLTTTIEGKESLKIILESRTEIRRVVWPTRTETTQTVLIVVVAIIICALLLWGLDSLFGWATAGIIGLNMEKQWYVIHAYSGYETKVREALIERIERLGMSDLFGEIMVPSEEVVEMRGGQERKTQRKFFPGYVLVNMELNDDSWHLVKDTL